MGFHVPVIPSVDVDGNTGTFAFAQADNDVPKGNVGVRFGLTVTVNVVVVAHNPAVGVNVYTPEFWLSTDAGLHVPVIPLVDVAGNAGAAAPAQIVVDVPKLNEGGIFGFTFTVNVVELAQGPALGVNVYTPDVVLLTTAGLHVPLIPSVDVLGNTGIVPPEQIVDDVPKLKTGVTFCITVTFITNGNAH